MIVKFLGFLQVDFLIMFQFVSTNSIYKQLAIFVYHNVTDDSFDQSLRETTVKAEFDY